MDTLAAAHKCPSPAEVPSHDVVVLQIFFYQVIPLVHFSFGGTKLTFFASSLEKDKAFRKFYWCTACRYPSTQASIFRTG